VLGLLLAGLPGCSRQSRSPLVLYREIRLSFLQGNFAAAEQRADEAYRRFQSSHSAEAWRFRALKGEILRSRGRFQDALELLAQEPPRALAGDEAAVRRPMTQALASAYLGDMDRAQAYVQTAEQLAATKQPALLAEVAWTRGTVALVHGDNAVLEASMRQAQGLLKDHPDPYLEAMVLRNLGVAYGRRQHYGEAIEWFTASLRLAERTGDRAAAMRASGNLGWSQFQLGNYEAALALHTEAEALARELGLESDQLWQLIAIGEAYENQGDHNAAEQSYLQALAIARKLQQRSRIGVCLSDLALIAIERGQFAPAEAYEREALEIRRAGKERALELYSLEHLARIAAGNRRFAEAESGFRRVIREAGEDVPLVWEAEGDLAKLFVAENQPARAEAQFRRTLATIEGLRSSVIKEEQRLSFLATARYLYDGYIDFLIAQGRMREALQASERSRARTLAEGLRLEETKLGRLPFRPERTARELNAVILSYWLTPRTSYLWAIRPTGLTLYKLPAEGEITAAVQRYRKALAGPQRSADAANPDGEKLFAMLLGPARPAIRPGSRVIVVADGSLHGLNFETLPLPGPQLRYWIEDAVVANADSLALLAGNGRKRRQPGHGLLLIGDPNEATSEYPRLPQAGLELEKVAAHFPAEARLLLARDRANPSAYGASHPERFGYIHFVAHASASRLQPLDSGIVLSPENGAYTLYARDIMRQPLQAEVVTISGCYGAGTRAYSGEGLVGLSWSFLRAGARHVIASLWEVNDTSAPELMDRMYLDLGQGHDPAQALRNAKLAMLHSDGVYRRPYYWGTFQVYLGER
jgi:CHAT domain-containing protein/tetratricopeptide (TPR) repeat protein